MTIAGIVSPSGVVKSVATTVGDVVLPGPSTAEREVDSLYEEIDSSPFWINPPSMSMGSREILIDEWDRFQTDRTHAYSTKGIPWVSLGDIYTESVWDGKVVRLRSYVSQVYRLTPIDGADDQVLVNFKIADGGEDEVVWCNRTTLDLDQAPQVDQLVDIVGVVIARGSASTTDGGFQNGSFMICPRVDPLVAADHATEVVDLFRDEETSSFWMDTPTLSSDARMYLMRNWPRLTPYAVHPFPDRPPKYVEIDQIHEDVRFDGRESWVSGYVSQRKLSSSGKGETFLQVRLDYADQDSNIWCRTTVQSWRAFHLGDHVEAVGVPVARGSAELSGGGFVNTTVMVCPAMRKV